QFSSGKNIVFILYIQSCDKNEDPVSTNTSTNTNNNPYGGDNGKVTFYTTLSSGWSNINVTLQDTNIGTLTHYFNSGAPSCDQTNGTVSAVKKNGNYSYVARTNTNIQWSGTVDINKEQCKTIQLSGNGNGSDECEWDYWRSLIGVTASWGPYDLCSSQNTLRVKVTNNANVQMYIKVCIKRENGTYDCGALWKNPGSSETFYGCPATGVYYIWAKPSTVGGECPMPSPPEPNP
ncbi:MAG: hypothetical protein JSS91_05310, partial [Bacteroidetes bacterium]|nr:hypothetical protein [Bacteroidota bacterium]